MRAQVSSLMLLSIQSFSVATTHLNTVVTISKIVHWLKLLVNDSDASFVGAIGDLLDIGSRLAHLSQLLVDDLGCLNGRLRVEFSWQ